MEIISGKKVAEHITAGVKDRMQARSKYGAKKPKAAKK